MIWYIIYFQAYFLSGLSYFSGQTKLITLMQGRLHGTVVKHDNRLLLLIS